MPSLSANIFNPGASPGQGGVTTYLFSVDHDANYSIDIYAYFEPILHSGTFAPCAAYCMPNGTWLVVAQEGWVSIFPKTLWLGIGPNAAGLQWQVLGQVNSTAGIAVAANNTAIRVVYTEKNVDGLSDTDPVKWVKYFASDDWGVTWTNGTLWDCSALNQNWFPGISMAANATTFECMWCFANNTDSNGPERNNLTTIWEARDAGMGWTSPKNLTAMNGMHGTFPQVIFNQTSGELFACVNNYSATTDLVQSIVYRLGHGPDAVATDTWNLTSLISSSYIIPAAVYCALDNVTNHFYFVNLTDFSTDGIRNASSWKGVIGETDSFVTEKTSPYFNLFAAGGPKLFASQIFSIYNSLFPKGGLLGCQPPFFFRHLNGSLNAGEILSYVFDGKDPAGNTHGALAYYFNTTVSASGATDTLSPYPQLTASVDTTAPTLNVTTSSGIISPLSSPGVLDTFTASVNASKYGTASLAIESLDHTFSGTTNATDGLYSYFEPAICGDGHVIYLFYIQFVGGTNFDVMYTASLDGGVSWSVPRSLATYDSYVSQTRAACQGREVCCWVAGTNFPAARFLSFDGGTTFAASLLSTPVDRVASDLTCWRLDGEDSYDFNISQSLDFGATWNLFVAIPQNGFDYRYFDGVAYDPISGNYSFLLAGWTDPSGLRFVTTNHNGSKISSEDGLGAGFNQSGPALFDDTAKLGWQEASNGSTDWIIVSCAYNNEPGHVNTQALGYIVKQGNGDFSPWANYTAISPSLTYVENYSAVWDIGFPVNGTPVATTLVEDPNPVLMYTQVQVFYGTPFVFSTTETVPSGTMGSISFSGVDSKGQILPDGNYRWTMSFTDLAGDTVSQSGNLIIDNTPPTLASSASFTTPARPIPAYATTVMISADDAHLASGTLYYHTAENGYWVSLPMIMVPTDAMDANYIATLPSSNSSTIYWNAVISDAAGNSLLVDNNGQPYSYSRPNLRIQEVQDPPLSIDLNKFSKYPVQILVPQDADFMAYVLIEYTLDDGMGLQIANMTAISSGVYAFTFANFSKDVSSLSYTFVGVDIFGNQVPFGKTRSIVILPAMPKWDMSGAEQIAVMIISAIVGAVCGVIYSKLVQKKPTLRELTLAENEREEKMSRFWATRALAAKATLVVMGGLLGMAVASLLIFHWPELSMLFLVGLFLATTFMWILVTDAVVIKTLRSGQLKINKRAMMTVLGVGFSIFLTLFAILFVGDIITWWRVRVNSAAYIVLGIGIPELLVSLASAFFTSILLLSWTVGVDVSRTASELYEEELNHVNPGLLMERREDAISRIQGAVGMKAIIFLAVIGGTFIFSSDLNIYTIQSFFIIVPFVLGTLVVIALSAFWRKISTRKEADVLYDHLTSCPACGAETGLGGGFCENCGAKIIAGTRVLDGYECPQCGMLNPASGKHCRFCGASIESAATSIPASNVEEPLE